ncbi:precorrin-3B synthase [Maritimibacter alkaliphilus]|uniref:precorrin-3B synthase n=1 Tax=Maritimibacter alkaliphilus TaxID=404236 RepID=UPI001C95F740|nr:precorrin-3B synthase [Maritimibacter alkaliphilus]MBY6092620.1 precorrin-3B synthase [Maritimibacter alkaliphilus]
MTGEFTVRGWCPGALRPMMSGDGLVVRLRAPGGRLSQRQASEIACAARDFGNGLIDLSARANLQLRGVREADHPALIERLRPLGLIDASEAGEARRNILVTPFADGATDDLAARLAAGLDDLPALPGKFGFVLDTGPSPVLTHSPGDIRLERTASGQLLLRCDGAARGAVVAEAEAVDRIRALAQWFVAAGGIRDGRGRMAALIAQGTRPEGELAPTVCPAPTAPEPGPGIVAQGALLGLAFGQMTAETLAWLAVLGPLRLTPWRMVLIERLHSLPAAAPGVIRSAADPLRRVAACTGAPGCPQGHAAVRGLAARLAQSVPEGRMLHLSGCAKGCAHPAPAALTLVATDTGFDLIRAGTARDTPERRGIAAEDIDLEGLF